jgi:hypothetical protein
MKRRKSMLLRGLKQISSNKDCDISSLQMGIIKIKQLEMMGEIGETGDSRLRGNDGKHGLLRAGALAKNDAYRPFFARNEAIWKTIEN